MNLADVEEKELASLQPGPQNFSFFFQWKLDHEIERDTGKFKEQAWVLEDEKHLGVLVAADQSSQTC